MASSFIIPCVRVRSRFLFRVAPISLVRIIVSALLCGAANSLLPRVIRFLLPNKGAESIYIAPEFRFGSAWVYMEGIIGLNLAKLIGIIGKEVTRYVASRGKHNAEYNGTIKANG